MTEATETEFANPVARLSRDLANAAKTLTADEARFLVDAYYVMQANRIRSGNQIRALGESGEPHDVLKWFAEQDQTLENQIKRALDKYSAANPLSEWARSVCGIGPVISAGLLAHIDITKAPTAGHIWRYAGLDPTSKWEKKTRRPWNAALKRLCFLIGESFVKVQNNEDDIYGKIYAKRKAEEIAKNEAGEFADQAAAVLEAKKIGKDTDAYKAYSIGKLPPAHIHARARRYAVKHFLSDYQLVGWWLEHQSLPPLPYPIAHLEHAHYQDRVSGSTLKGLIGLQDALAKR